MKIQVLNRQAGISLLEITAVVAILGITALTVIPNFSASDPQKLDLAAQRVADAVRFSRNESVRTGEHYGVTISQSTQVIRVKKWDLTTDPVSTELIPYHPVSKQPFEYDADGLSLTPGVSISNSSDIFKYPSIGRRRSVIFDAQGVPVWVRGSDDSRYLLEEGIVELSVGGGTRTVSVTPLTGRVTVQ